MPQEESPTDGSLEKPSKDELCIQCPNSQTPLLNTAARVASNHGRIYLVPMHAFGISVQPSFAFPGYLRCIKSDTLKSVKSLFSNVQRKGRTMRREDEKKEGKETLRFEMRPRRSEHQQQRPLSMFTSLRILRHAFAFACDSSTGDYFHIRSRTFLFLNFSSYARTPASETCLFTLRAKFCACASWHTNRQGKKKTPRDKSKNAKRARHRSRKDAAGFQPIRFKGV